MRTRRQNSVKFGVGRMKVKAYFVIFSNDCSILELMLWNPNLPKLVYRTLLGSDCKAWPLKLSEHSKKKKKIHNKKAKKTLFRQLKGLLINVKFLIWGKTHFFWKNFLLYTINTLSVVMEIIISKVSYSLKMISRYTFPQP